MPIVKYLADSLLNAGLLLLTGLIPWLLIALILQLLSGAIRRSAANIFGIKTYIYLTAPGVMIHELGHLIFCWIFRHEVTEVQLFSPSDDGTLGYVNHRYNPESLYQRIGNFFISTGPVWGGITVLHLITSWLIPDFEYTFASFTSHFFTFSFWASWRSWLWLYLAFTIISHVTLSKEDLHGAKDGFSVIIGTVLFCSLGLGWLGNWEKICIDFLLQLFLGFLPLLLTVCGFSLLLAFILLSFRKRR